MMAKTILHKLRGRMWIAMLMLCAVASFALTTTVIVRSDTGNQEAPVNPPDLHQPTSVEEASALLGWEVVMPGYLPSNLEGPYIEVELDAPGGMSRATLNWKAPGDQVSEGIRIDEVKNLSGIGGKAFTIGSLTGQRAFYPPEPDQGKPFTSEALFWKQGDIGYVVFGGHGNTINSSELLNVAISLQREN